MSTENSNSPDLPGPVDLDVDQPSSEDTIPPKTISDLAPELITKILEFVALDGNKENMLSCRKVNSQWKEIMDSIIENGFSSAKFEAFPVMRTESIDGQLKVRCSTTRFAEGRNPFPFNSLQLTTGPSSSIAPKRSQSQLLSLPVFASRFGGNLTTLSLQHITTISLTTLAEMLSSMSNLKQLTLMNVMEMEPPKELVIPTAPPLPKLTGLKVGLRILLSMEDKAYVVLVWLIGSYADQLELLQLDSVFPLPPLQAGKEYTYSDSSGETHPIVTTSESAFRKLKQLLVWFPSQEFLMLSETPALQDVLLLNTSVGVLLTNFTLADVLIFIGKCRSTLETLYLNFMWNESRNEEVFRNFLEEHRATEVACPRLETVFIHYPCTILQEMVLSTFLNKFSVLKTINFFRFRVHQFDEGVSVDLHQNVNEHGNEEEIVALKVRLAPLYQRMVGIQNDTTTASSAKAALFMDLPQDEVQMREVAAQGRRLDAEIGRLNAAMNVARNVRAEIYNRLAALGEHTKEVMVQQMLERGGFWNTLPNLRTVSVSSGLKPEEDVCVVERSEDA